MSRKASFRAAPRSGVLLCTALLLCASCAGSPGRNGSSRGSMRQGGRDAPRSSGSAARTVYVTDTKAVSLLPPSCMAGSMDTFQLLTGSYGTQHFALQAYTRADADGISMTLLNEMGITVATLSYTKDGTNFQSAYLPDSIRAEYMLLDFQNACYDASALRDHYAASGLRFERSREGGRDYRRIYDGRKLIEEIITEENTAAGTRLSVQNRLRSYRYELAELTEPAEAVTAEEAAE